MIICYFIIFLCLGKGIERLIDAYQERRSMRDLRIIIRNLRDAYDIPSLACDTIVSQLARVHDERRRDKILKSFETKWKEDYKRRQRLARE